MDKVFMKGNEAIPEAAIRAGCRFFAGYPITPQNEMPEYMSRRMPEVGGVFLQAESEVAASNMLYGAGAGGARAMTSSSSIGIALKSEGISHLAGARIPAVIVNVNRGGPGIGSIGPSQQDYFQATKAITCGGSKMIVLSPATVQEAVDLTYKAFDYADRDRNPVMVFTDAAIGNMMESVVLPEDKTTFPDKSDWIITGCKGRDSRSITSFVSPIEAQVEQFNIQTAQMYERWQKEDVLVEELMLDDAEIVITAFGFVGRIAQSAMKTLREQGIKAGLIRPITVSPFPYASYRKLDSTRVKHILCSEMAIPGQMVEDVQLAVCGNIPISSYNRSGGVPVQDAEIVTKVKEMTAGEGL
ncbi:MAG: 3-methyl-2-oxobutanoate dehydrogenase subunit VorB [Deltaproteobacteria bacterium]|nr:3-methyl-2-oxobutanoate dehydrogenase subunit VorB [Deltaproteobacteria bacterium]